LPAAVSADSITASVPSSTALATSETSARVGTGERIIDSIICVAVMVSLFLSRARRIIFFCRAGTAASPTSTARSPRATMMPSEASRISSRLVDGFDALDLGDQHGAAAGGAHQLARHVHVGGALREGDGDEIDADLRRRLDVVHVLGGQRRRGQAAALAVDALVVRQLAADQHAGVDFLAATRR
jgi:hypothetical protein